MGNISSANFKKSKDFQVYHNADIRPSYAIGGGLEVNRNGNEALALKKQIIEQAIDTYNRTKKPKAPPFKAKSYEWSLVVNLKESSTMQDLETLSAHFKDKYGFQCYQIAIHRDEGHIDNGEKRINHHAHLEFVTLDEKTGKNRFRGGFATAKCLRAVQDEVAEILQMERGVDKRLSGAKRVEPRKYAIMKEREKAERKADLEKVKREKNIPLEIRAEFAETKLNELKAENATLKEENEELKVENIFLNKENEQLLDPKEVKETLESFRKQCIGKGLPKEFFRALSSEKQSPKQSTKQDLELFCADLLRAYENKNIELQNLEIKLQKEREAREKAENDRARLATELESKTTENMDFAPTSSATLDTPKSAETTQSVETTQKTEPKIDAPIKEQKPTEISISEAFNKALTSANCQTKMYWHTSEEKSIYVKDISAQKAEIIKDKMESQGFFVAYNEDRNNRTTINGVKWNIMLIVSRTKEAFEKAKEWLQNRLGSLIYKTDTNDTFQDKMAKLDKAVIETKKLLTPKETLQEQMKEQVKKAVYNQRETPKKDLGISR